MHNDDPDAVDAMLQYMYTGTWDPRGHSSAFGPDKSQRMLHDLSIFTLADKYSVPELLRAACTDFTITLAECKFFRGDLGAIIRELYIVCPDNKLSGLMRAAVIKSSVASEDHYLIGRYFFGWRSAVQDVTLFGIEYKKASLENATRVHGEVLAKAKADHELSLAQATADHKKDLDKVSADRKGRGSKTRMACVTCNEAFVLLDMLESQIVRRCPFCGKSGGLLLP